MEWIPTRDIYPSENGAMQETEQKKHKWNLDYVIILDYGYKTKGTLMNPDLANNIKPIKSPWYMSSNEGTKKMTLQGDVNKFGCFWYDLTHMANIFELSHISDKHHITYENCKEYKLLVQS